MNIVVRHVRKNFKNVARIGASIVVLILINIVVIVIVANNRQFRKNSKMQLIFVGMRIAVDNVIGRELGDDEAVGIGKFYVGYVYRK